MNKYKYVYLLVALVFIGCDSSKQQDESESKDESQSVDWIDPSKIEQGSIVHDSLTSSQLENIEYLYNTFSEVDPTTQEKWIEDFRRDKNPENEIGIWMMMANAYNSYCQRGEELDLEVKKEVFQIVLLRSSVSEEEVLAKMKLERLTKENAIEIMSFYTLDDRPIQVIEK